MVQEAYSRAFRLFAALFGFPVPDGVIDTAGAIELLSEVLPDRAADDDWGSRHYELFGMGVFPHAGVYLSADGLMGGAAARELNTLFSEAGYTPPSTGEETDSISTHLDFLAFLTTAGSGTEGVDQAVQFVEKNLLSWLPPFVVATKLESDPFYSHLAGLTWELLASFVRETGHVLRSREWKVDEKEIPSSIKHWSHFLASSRTSGWFVSRSAIAGWGRKMKAPRGFGNRQQMIQTLLESSDRYEASSPDDNAIQESITTWLTAYRVLAEENDNVLSGSVTPWISRLQSTEKAFSAWSAARGKESGHVPEEERELSSMPDSMVVSSSDESGSESR